MKKKLVVFLFVFLGLMVVVSPALGFSAIQFNVVDSVNVDPWGTAPGQSYRIYITGSASGILLDTGVLTTPTDPVLNFTCAYGAVCPPGSATTLTTPASGETVYIYIVLEGTTNDPSTIIKSFIQPPTDLGSYTIVELTGTGPTAITLQAVAGQELPLVLPVVGITAVLLIATIWVLLKRRQQQAL